MTRFLLFNHACQTIGGNLELSQSPWGHAEVVGVGLLSWTTPTSSIDMHLCILSLVESLRLVDKEVIDLHHITAEILATTV